MTALIITGVVFSVCIVAMLYVAKKMDEEERKK